MSEVQDAMARKISELDQRVSTLERATATPAGREANQPTTGKVAEKHTLYETSDGDVPACLKDSNGEVVLGMCRVCGKAESELDQPCVSPSPTPAPTAPTPGVVAAAKEQEAVGLAIEFHKCYERQAPSHGYETRTETREFDPLSANGRLMTTVCQIVMVPKLAKLRAECERLKDELEGSVEECSSLRASYDEKHEGEEAFLKILADKLKCEPQYQLILEALVTLIRERDEAQHDLRMLSDEARRYGPDGYDPIACIQNLRDQLTTHREAAEAMDALESGKVGLVQAIHTVGGRRWQARGDGGHVTGYCHTPIAAILSARDSILAARDAASGANTGE